MATVVGWRKAYPVLKEAGKEATEDLRRGLSHPEWRVRRWCAALMDHHADPSCVQSLIGLLDDPIADVRRSAVHALGCGDCKDFVLDVDVVSLLVECVASDPSIRVRRVAVHMLGCQPPDTRAVEALNGVLKDCEDAKLRANAGWALARHLEESERSVGPAGGIAKQGAHAERRVASSGGVEGEGAPTKR
jgi:HEAT repeat protein